MTLDTAYYAVLLCH